MPAAPLPLLDSFSALADPTRCRMLAVLERQELTVTELCAVLQAPQSTVSRHLKTLADADWVSSRRDGTSRYYTLARAGSGDGAQQEIWRLTRRQLEGRVELDQDVRRLQGVLARRSESSQQFFASAAGRWDHLREELFRRDFATPALLSLLPREWVVGDLGCGTGALLPVLAPIVARVIGVDASEDMLAAARTRTAGLANAELRRGSLEALPLDDDSLDAALCVLVLHHVASPAAAIAAAARALKPGGRLLLVDMAPHDREEYREQMGHVWLGFSEGQLSTWLADAGFTQIAVRDLPAADDAKGPSLLTATGTKPRRVA